MKNLNNVLGAFADAAILFPLMALLTTKAGFPGPMILFTAGLAYLFSSYFFKVPMPIQPLKSITVAAVSVGASFLDVRLSTLLLGLFCWFLARQEVEKYARKVPEALIHQLQLGLGILLFLQGLRNGMEWVVLPATALLIFFPVVRGIPLLGLLATLGLITAVFTSEPATSDHPVHSIFSFDSKIHPYKILGLLLPQIALTLTNSVLATQDVAKRTFGREASKVTIQNLLKSIGLGNIVTGLLGGLPFCHGSGGLTAHVRGGSTREWSTMVIGGVLILLSLVQGFKGSSEFEFPPALIGILLMSIGWFHMQLAKPTYHAPQGKTKLILAGLVTLFSRNLLYVLLGGVALEMYYYYKKKQEIGPEA